MPSPSGWTSQATNSTTADTARYQLQFDCISSSFWLWFYRRLSWRSWSQAGCLPPAAAYSKMVTRDQSPQAPVSFRCGLQFVQSYCWFAPWNCRMLMTLRESSSGTMSLLSSCGGTSTSRRCYPRRWRRSWSTSAASPNSIAPVSLKLLPFGAAQVRFLLLFVIVSHLFFRFQGSFCLTPSS